MNLTAYMEARNLDDAEVARRAGLSRSQVSRIRRGVSDPPLSTWTRIVAATDGLVTHVEAGKRPDPALPETVGA